MLTDLGEGDFLVYNSSGILCLPIQYSCTAKDYFTYSDYNTNKNAVIPSNCIIRNVAFKPTSQFAFDGTANGCTALYYFSNMAEGVNDENDIGDATLSNQQNLYKELKDISLNEALGLKFVPYELGEGVIVESVACSYHNTFSRLSLKMMDGYAFQYCGGQDTAIEISIVTQNSFAVSMLQQLPRQSAYFCRNYRQVLNCWPLRIDSEFTKFIGVNEVIIESVTSETIENQPGVIRLNLVLYAVDRTTRSRETLKLMDIPNNAGSTKDYDKTTREQRTMFDLKTQLAKAELYPDLQLPTIEEMAEAGFVLYRNKKISNYAVNPTYPDPDFYFLYAQTLSNEVFKNAILNNLQKMNFDYDITDMTGALMQYTIKNVTDSDGNVSTVGKNSNPNDIAIKQAEIYKNLFNDLPPEGEKAVTENDKETTDFNVASIQKEVFDKLNIMDKQYFMLPETFAYLHTPFWNINTKARLAFREKTYEQLSNFPDTEVGKALAAQQQALVNDVSTVLKMPIVDINELRTLKADITTSDIATYDKLSKWGESKIKKGLEYAFKQYSITDIFTFLSNTGLPLDTITNLFMAVADAYTGDNYYANNYGIISKIVENEEDEHFDNKNWKVKCFMNYSNDVVPQGSSNIEEHLIPYCKTGSGFATSLEDAIKNGISFGPFQIRMYSKKEIEYFEGKKCPELSDKRFYFLDPYYRNLQVNSGDNSEFIKLHKKHLCMQPNYCAIAYVRQILYFLRKLVSENTLLSVYELLKKEAHKVKATEVDLQQPDASNTPSTEKSIETFESEGEKIFEPFYDLLGILIGCNEDYQDKDMRELLITDVLKLDKDKDKNFIKAIKKAKGTEEQLTDFIDKCKEQIDDTENNSPETIVRYKFLLQHAQAHTDAISFAHIIKQQRLYYNTQVALNAEGYTKIQQLLQEDNERLINGYFMALNFILFSPNVLLPLLKDKNIMELDRLMITFTTPSVETESELIRKYIYALIGRKVLDDINADTTGRTPTSVYQNLVNEHVDVWRSNSPRHYLKDSYYDMIHTDKRGRMVRAFPTYYLMFVDEGREIGLWHLHDNFYNMNSIAEVEVSKSRKLAADTAHIVMTNMFANYTQPDFDTYYNMDITSYANIHYTLRDAFFSIFSPRVYYEQEELLRQITEPDITAPLQSGTRLQLRMGYGSNASELPILFNGQIAEITNGEIVEIVAQGDGVELTNPILETDNVEDIQNDENNPVGRAFDNWLTNGITPKNMLATLLISEGKWLHKKIKEITHGRFYNTNPFGIFHFGDYRYTSIFQNSECVQNLFEVYNQAIYGASIDYKGLEEQYRLSDIPRISVHCEGKTFWDLMHIAASTAPDYICAVAPFEMRSTVFLGAGRYYYAYEYVQETDPQTGNKIIKEHRKPFEQHHFYTSVCDIIDNQIYATSKDVRTNAVGYYTETHHFGSEKTQKVGPLYVDFD